MNKKWIRSHFFLHFVLLLDIFYNKYVIYIPHLPPFSFIYFFGAKKFIKYYENNKRVSNIY